MNRDPVTDHTEERAAKRSCKIKPLNANGSNDSSEVRAETNSTDIISSPIFDNSFLTKYISFYASYKPPSKKTKNLPTEILSTRRSIQHCCRDNNLRKGLQVLKQAIHDCVYIEAQSFYNLLNLCEGSFGKGAVHVGTPRPKDDSKIDGSDSQCNSNDKRGVLDVSTDDTNDGSKQSNGSEITLAQRLSSANEIHSLLSRLKIPCTEPTYTALIRLASRVGDFDQAEKYLDEAEGTQQCKVKLRMYSALIRGYCGDFFHDVKKDSQPGSCSAREGSTRKVTKDHLVKALKVWARMYNHSGTADPNLFGEGISPKIQLSEIEYSSLVKAATTLGDSAVMERMLSDLAEKVLVPGMETTESVLCWFRADGGNSGINRPVDYKSALHDVSLPPCEVLSIGDVCNDNGKGWMICKGCTIDSATGQLTMGDLKADSSSGMKDETFKLKPVELSTNAWADMRLMNSKIVLEGQVEGHLSQYQGGGKGKKRPWCGNGNDDNGLNKNTQSNTKHQIEIGKQERRVNIWKEFESFIESHPPYNVVIDGANVGYFQQNFSNAPKHVDYKQIDWLLRDLLENEQHIILFLHERHFSPKLCPPWAFNITNAWEEDRPPYHKLTVYRTPAGMNDDWYWMHAALKSGNNSHPILAITNDEMRDHHFQMLAQGSFLRWKERHQVHFDFGVYNKVLGRREVLLKYPSPYSRRIQRISGENGTDAIAIPLPKRGDEGRYVDGCHVADETAPDDETYVVICKVV